jgi:hypothetical protein
MFTFILEKQKKIDQKLKSMFRFNKLQKDNCLDIKSCRLFPQNTEMMSGLYSANLFILYEKTVLPLINFCLNKWPMFCIFIWASTVKLRTSRNFWPTCPWASGIISYFHTPVHYLNLSLQRKSI